MKENNSGQKQTHPDFEAGYSLPRRILLFLLVFPPLAIVIVAAFMLGALYIETKDNKVIGLSNGGFGALIALSSVCFSYYKVLQDQKYIKIHFDVQKSGEHFFASAIAFLCSSVLKSAELNAGPNGFIPKWAGHLVKPFTLISFGIAEMQCILGLSFLTIILYFRITNSTRKSPPSL